MEIIILNDIPETNNKNEYYTIGTHNGMFHCDEVVAVALLCLLHHDKKVVVVRSRNEEVLNKCDIWVDAGGGEFDHHQEGFNKKRDGEEGIPYASAGLIFNKFGHTIISQFLSKLQPAQNITTLFNNKDEITDKEKINEICEKMTNNYSLIENNIIETIEKEIIEPVDAEDSGVDLGQGLHGVSFIPTFRPRWYNKKPDYDGKFLKVLEATIEVLEEKIENTIDRVYAKEIIKPLLKQPEFFSNGILQIPAQIVPWEEAVCEYNEQKSSEDEPCNFVMFPYPDGGCGVQCVPPSMQEKFDQRVPFLQELSLYIKGIKKINKGFFATGEKEALIELCNTATQIENEKLKWKNRLEEYGEQASPQKEQEALKYILEKIKSESEKEQTQGIR